MNKWILEIMWCSAPTSYVFDFFKRYYPQFCTYYDCFKFSNAKMQKSWLEKANVTSQMR